MSSLCALRNSISYGYFSPAASACGVRSRASARGAHAQGCAANRTRLVHDERRGAIQIAHDARASCGARGGQRDEERAHEAVSQAASKAWHIASCARDAPPSENTEPLLLEGPALCGWKRFSSAPVCVCAQVCALRSVMQAPRGVRALTLQRTVAPSRSDRPATSSCSWLSAMTYLAARGRQGVSEDKDPPPTALSRYKQRRWTHRERSGRCGSASPRTPAALRETPQGSAAAGT
jgi:hypothetical protein